MHKICKTTTQTNKQKTTWRHRWKQKGEWAGFALLGDKGSNAGVVIFDCVPIALSSTPMFSALFVLHMHLHDHIHTATHCVFVIGPLSFT